jgi:hypothetical protein
VIAKQLFIPEHRLTMTNFLHFLTEQFLSLMADVPVNERLMMVAERDGGYLCFNHVRAYSSQSYGSLCTDCTGPAPWPPRFPDLAELDSVL